MQLRLTRRAERDLRDIWRYVARERTDAADRVLRQIDAHLRNLETMPDLGRHRPELGSGVRCLVVERWLVLYRVDAEAVVVSRVLDGARDLTTLALPRR